MNSDEKVQKRIALAAEIEADTRHDAATAIEKKAVAELGAVCDFKGGTYRFRCLGLMGTCTASTGLAVRSWARAVRRKHG